MDKSQKSFCTSEIGAEVLMFITSFIIFFILALTALQEVLSSKLRNYRKKLNEKIVGIFVSSAYALFLPLMSYMFSQAKQNNPQRSQVILIWMVLFEVIRLRVDDVTWELKKSAEQVVRLAWVGFLVYGYTPLNLLRASLLVLCVFSIICEVLKGITFYQAKDSYLIGKNPKLIHDYMNRVMLQDDLRTTPMNNCDYIVMGEENHEIAVCKKGYHLGDKNSSSEGKLTVGRIFQLNSSEDKAFTLSHPDWRDTCLSFALAKILRRRFVNLPLDEAGSSKALKFVLEGLIDYIGSNRDIQTDSSNGGRNRHERVFSIIEQELKFVSEFLNAKVPTLNYFRWRVPIDVIGSFIMVTIGMYLCVNTLYLLTKDALGKPSSAMPSPVAQDADSNCIMRHVNGRYDYDQFITMLLAGSCAYIQYKVLQVVLGSNHWSNLRSVKRYIENPAKWKKFHSSTTTFELSNLLDPFVRLGNMINTFLFPNAKNNKQVTLTIFDVKSRGRICNTLRKWIRKAIPRPFLPTILHGTHVKEAILSSLRKSSGQLTNGETALKNHGILVHLNQVWQPSGSTTEAILTWHIATTLFLHQHPPPQQNNDPFEKERRVASDLSSYCVYLLVCLPELLPEEVEWTEERIESVKEEIFAIDRSSTQKPTAVNRCNYAMDAGVTWDEKSLVGKGAKLAKELADYSNIGTQVWTMLSEFWAEMMLFISPSDNVEGHGEILEKGELITQVWALLTHAGILTRPKSTEDLNHGIESNEVTEGMTV
ncbi:hypothetical protein LUZ62_048001 [Rhynchospora pubera]|uniref:DUF4220 domain-containing protein n=1 Tax=Rhynchospora pubera TaxID=906938 RepID=A0AAV8FYZ1_9POAL|nr:hypothetical protein LUZ62_048001 [Rhynchospora pubera]